MEGRFRERTFHYLLQVSHLLNTVIQYHSVAAVEDLPNLSSRFLLNRRILRQLVHNIAHRRGGRLVASREKYE